ncbi:ArsR/SmtB family transcription factor [Roseburia sp. 831b]|uniref:ArsR/SmtB family transcription factor n=1 Tax=Roseburia sp. 831b TaxID=1261635 RepID=UPI000951679C|nr:metalloregulator ArsR/SmtB family transcription factor [Roseburia sp. 831b]WVK72455.1 metalloregulator ArsR/SmtB family transcription factor [Roseburia sp. 831b]
MTEIFKALSEESRLRILSILIDTELCVCEIEVTLNLTQSNVSRHLTVLKRCGIVESRKDALWTYYRISLAFQQEHKELWLYLLDGLKKLPTFQSDREASDKNKARKLCSCDHSKGVSKHE